MAAVVNDVELVQVAAGYVYRARTQPLIGTNGRDQQQAAAAYQQDWQAEEELELLEGDVAEVDESLITQEGDSFVTQILVDSQLLPFIIGRGGNTKKEIEQTTGATLVIPRGTGPRRDHQQPRQQHEQSQQQVLGSSKSETVTIKGPSKQAVSSARVRTQLLIDGIINSRMLDWTHFVSIPLSNVQTAAKLQEFQNQVLAQPNAQQRGFDPSIFINPKTLHLTLLMLKLYSNEARHRAAQTLEGLKPQVQKLLDGQGLELLLRGLDYMSDDPSDIHVLYLKVSEQGPGQHLQALCELVVKAFEDAGLLLPRQSTQVKLHATIINTRHRRLPREQQQQQQQGAGRPQKQQQQERLGFNGQQLLKDWAELDLGVFAVPALHISQRHAYDAATGYYASLASLPLQLH